MSLTELQEKRKEIDNKFDITTTNMTKIAEESMRVADVAHNSKEILSDLDCEFESATGLKGKDVLFLFTAVGLQLMRIAVINELTKIEKAGNGNCNETKLHDFQKKLLDKFNSGNIIEARPYYASMKHIIEKTGVPYDATAPLTEDAIQRLLGKDGNRKWSFDINDFIPTERIKLFRGANHRFSTLGHDPILGLLFGTANIMTNTITCVQSPVLAEKIKIPILTTNHVIYTSDYKDPRIATYASTADMLYHAVERTKEEPSAFLAALIKQIIHLGTDLYTPKGIQIPGVNLILSNTNVESLTKYISSGDIVKIGASAGVAEFINLLIGAVHTLMYDPAKIETRELYSIRTKKIILYSNAIATGSNVIWVGINAYYGNESALRQLDIGGLLVTLKHLFSDTEYIRKIKEEFVFGGFKKMIQGENLDLEEIIWE